MSQHSTRHRRVGCALAALALAALACSRTAPPGARVSVDPTPWIADLATDDLFVSEPAAAKLVNLGDAALPALIDAYRRGEAQQRLNIMEVAGAIGTPRAAELLAQGCADEDDEVRDEALSGLTRLALPESAAAVERAVLQHRDRPSRAVVNACLALCRSPAALERLLQDAVDGEPPSKYLLPFGGVRRLRSDAERAPLVDALLDRAAVPLLGADTPPRVRVRAALLTAERDPPVALPILLAYGERGDDIVLRSYALIAVGGLGGDGDVPHLLRMTHSDDARQTLLACRTLGMLLQRGIRVPAEELSDCLPPAATLPSGSAGESQ